jgi:hypothetical protein
MFTSPGHVADPGFAPFRLPSAASTSTQIHRARTSPRDQGGAHAALARVGVAVELFDTIDAYWRLVDVPDDPLACHPWRGTVDAQGRGWFSVTCGSAVPAHYFVYALAHDLAALQRAGDVRHRCGNLWCQNPEHLAPTRFAA